MPVAGLAGSPGIAFLLSTEVVYAIIAKDCSSPQTAEINADKRASTLMKWVHVGVVEAAAMVLIASMIEPQLAGYFIFGGVLAGGITYAEYLYAKKSGLNSCEPGTET